MYNILHIIRINESLDFISIDLKQLVAPSIAADRKIKMDVQHNAAW